MMTKDTGKVGLHKNFIGLSGLLLFLLGGEGVFTT
jgi:hypothetical protein